MGNVVLQPQNSKLLYNYTASNPDLQVLFLKNKTLNNIFWKGKFYH